MPAPFDPQYPVCFCQGSKGQVYAYQGYGNPGKVWRPTTGWGDVGLAAPATAPSLAAHADIRYYVARIDLTETGNGFTEPPTVTISATTAPTSAATALARIRGGGLLDIYMQSYGKGYTEIPAASLTEPTGMPTSNAELEVTISASQNNWNPGSGDIIVVDADAAGYTLTGLAAGTTGQAKRIRIVGDFGIGIAINSGSSSSANRFQTYLFSGTRVCQPNRTLHFVYQSSAWRLIRVTNDTSVEGAAGGAATVIAVPHLRGKYQCYYRYVDTSIPESEGGPIYSSLSPVYELDVPIGSKQATWTYAVPPGSLAVELWRSTSNQATTLFRIARITSPSGTYVDDLTDWELMDSTRGSGNTEYRAMPILLPNGELNANRFGVPPDGYSCAVFFQDRLWMAGSTDGSNSNTLRFSEVDEPESMPDVNELILQNNLRSTDYITALVPYAGVLLAMQSRHCHRLTYVAQPLAEAATYLVAYRGCLNQRCWDIFDGRVYAMDDQGVYSLEPSGKVESLTLGIYNLWRSQIDFSRAAWFTVRADKRNALLRIQVAFKGDGPSSGSLLPTRMLVYSFDYQTWWEERYPDTLTCATEVRLDDGQVALVYGTKTGKLRLLGEGLTDIGVGAIARTTMSNVGWGYATPPRVTASGTNGHGAEFEASINSNGSVTGVRIKYPGTGFTSGSLVFEAPASPPADFVAAVGTFTIAEDVSPAIDEELPIKWHVKSGCFEFTTDEQNKKGGDMTQPRNCSVVYKPTDGDCDLLLQTFYNNAAIPRANVARRDRGTGFVNSETVPAAVLNMAATPIQEAEAHGVARSQFSGKVTEDMLGSDRHVSILLAGQQDDTGPVVIHSVDLHGVNNPTGEQ